MNRTLYFHIIDLKLSSLNTHIEIQDFYNQQRLSVLNICSFLLCTLLLPPFSSSSPFLFDSTIFCPRKRFNLGFVVYRGKRDTQKLCTPVPYAVPLRLARPLCLSSSTPSLSASLMVFTGLQFSEESEAPAGREDTSSVLLFISFFFYLFRGCMFHHLMLPCLLESMRVSFSFYPPVWVTEMGPPVVS